MSSGGNARPGAVKQDDVSMINIEITLNSLARLLSGVHVYGADAGDLSKAAEEERTRRPVTKTGSIPRLTTQISGLTRLIV